MVYGNLIQKTLEMAKELECDASHHHAKDKAIIFGDFKEGKQRTMRSLPPVHSAWASTRRISQYGSCGRAKHVIIVRAESGRAGRDGLRSEGIIWWTAEGHWRGGGADRSGYWQGREVGR